MGIVSLVFMVAGGFLAGLLVVAALVAGWEMLRQRELLDSMRRDRAAYAATSPLPLAGVQAGGEAAVARAGVGAIAGAARGQAVHDPRSPHWIETRPTVLSFAPAVDDETAARQREPDLLLD